eukprot:396157-Rhodomonas_salina.1
MLESGGTLVAVLSVLGLTAEMPVERRLTLNAKGQSRPRRTVLSVAYGASVCYLAMSGTDMAYGAARSPVGR